MFRRLFNLLAGISLALCLLAGALWVRCNCTYDYVVRASGGRCIIVDTARSDSLWVTEYDGWPVDEPLHWWHGEEGMVGYAMGAVHGSNMHWVYLGSDDRPIRFGYRGNRHPSAPMTRRSLYWLRSANWVLLTMPLPLVWIARRLWGLHARSQRMRQGLCLACGYNLSATPDRCPECGTVSHG
jgi:hypothetical protein